MNDVCMAEREQSQGYNFKFWTWRTKNTRS